MRFISASVIVASALPIGLAADGSCMPASASWTTYFPSGDVSWFTELTLTAVDIMVQGTDLPTTKTELETALTDAYDTGHILVSQSSHKNPDLNGGATDLPACLTCLLAYVTEVTEMYTDKSLPVECQSYGTFVGVTTKGVCLYALSGAVANFATCTGATEKDLASADTNLSDGRCTAQQIVLLDAEHNLYASLLNKVLYEVEDADFDAAYQALPCRDVFDNWLSSITTTNIAALKLNCGSAVSDPDFFTSTCTNTVINLPGSGNILSQYFTDLVAQLGGGFGIPIGEAAGERCTTDERTILSQIASYEILVKCSFEFDPTASANDWKGCVNTYWPLLGEALIGGNAMTCAACFSDGGGLGETLYDRETANALESCTTGSTVNTFDDDCLAEVASAGTFDKFYQCSGINLSARSTVCSATEIADLSPMITSVIPFIVLARTVISDTPGTVTDMLAEAINRLSNVPGFASGAGAPCVGCFAGLMSDIITEFDADANLANMCEDEYSNGCLGHDFLDDPLARFEACSGIELTKETAYSCDDDQYNLLTSTNLISGLFSIAVANVNTTLATVFEAINQDIATIEAATNVNLPCANCLGDMVISLFDLPDVDKAVCEESPSSCVGLVEVLPIINKFAACTNHTFAASSLLPATTAAPTSTSGSSGATTSNAASGMTVGLMTVGALLATFLVL